MTRYRSMLAAVADASRGDFTFVNVSPQLATAVWAAARPSERQLQELLNRKPGQSIAGSTVEDFDAFMERQQKLYPALYCDEPAQPKTIPEVPPVSAISRMLDLQQQENRVQAAVTAQTRTATPAVPSTDELRSTEMSKELADRYIKELEAVGHQLSLADRSAIQGFAAEYVADPALQAEYGKLGGENTYIAGRRAEEAGLIKRYGGVHRK